MYYYLTHPSSTNRRSLLWKKHRRLATMPPVKLIMMPHQLNTLRHICHHLQPFRHGTIPTALPKYTSVISLATLQPNFYAGWQSIIASSLGDHTQSSRP